MIRVNSTVKLNMATIERLTEAVGLALEQTAEALHTEVVQAQVVPRDKGTLQGEGFFVDYSESAKGKVTLVHSTPYARRLYFHPEYKFNKEPWEDKKGKHDGNPNAKGQWFEDWEQGGKEEEFAEKAFAEFYRRIADL